tara:strand:+ start:83 stop:628 length:546 start_codon:yes stop_codon:yes gene_type:complete
MSFLKLLLIISLILLLNNPAYASRNSDSYDGNIFPIYAGNGSIVPPQTTLKESISNKRVSILFFYLDDSANSKALAPIISGIDLIWKNNVDIIALTTDELQGKEYNNSLEEGYYWNGFIPQTVILDGDGNIKFNKNGLIDIDEVNNVISEILGIDFDNTFSVETFNEYNSIVSRKNNTKTN